MKKLFKGKRLKVLTAFVSAFSIMAASVIVLFNTGDMLISAETAPVWDGMVASGYASGIGTAKDPYIIETAEQLALAVTSSGKMLDGNTAAFFKVADGVKSIYLNDIEGKSYSEVQNYLSQSGRLWDNTCNFIGTIDGNGVTIYGMKQTGGATGLFSNLSDGAVIKNINIKYSRLTGGGAILADNRDKAAAVTISGCAVTENYTDGTAGFIRNIQSGASYEMVNCLFVSGEQTDNAFGAFVAEARAQGKIERCLAIGANPVSSGTMFPSNNYFFGLNNVYTDKAGGVLADYHKVVENSALKGQAAKATLTEFNFYEHWEITDSYPIPIVPRVFNGVKGEIWTGLTASAYAGGTGTKEEPYIIETAEQLSLAVNSGGKIIDGDTAAYFEIASDVKEIYLNDIKGMTYDEAQDYLTNSGNIWKSNGFIGHLDGNGCTVYGMKQVAWATGIFSSMSSGASLKNLNIKYSRLTGGGSVIAANVNTINGRISVKNCALIENYTDGTAAFFHNVYSAGGNVGTYEIIDCLYVDGEHTNADFGAFVNYSYVVGKIENCIAVGARPINNKTDSADNWFFGLMNVFSDNGDGVLNNIYKTVDNSALKGETAKNTLSGFDFRNDWTVTEGYPMPKVSKIYNGVKGEVWSGITADSYAGGDGTEENPYQIDTPERLARMLNYIENGAHYELTHDIYLNDVSDEKWYENPGRNTWIPADKAFTGHLDGNGYVVYGMYYYYGGGIGTTFAALIPIVGEGAVIERVGVSKAYISQPIDKEDCYAASIVGFVSNYAGSVYNSTDIDLATTLLEKGKKVPVISECFGDNTVYLQSKFAGGIVCGTDNPCIIKNCYFTGSLKAELEKNGMIIGNTWIYGNRIENCLGTSQTDDWFMAGARGCVQSYASYKSTRIKGSYYLTTKSTADVIKIQKLAQRVGEGAKEFMTELDFENIWQTAEGGTPVLRVFNTDTHNADVFSDRSYDPPDVKVSFVTNAEEIVLEPMIGDMLGYIELPKPTRKGFEFDGWYVYSDFQCEYTYDYYPQRDLALYAKWISKSIVQDFELYPNTDYDRGEAYRFNRPGRLGYESEYTHGGNKSMQRLSDVEGFGDCLLNYENLLTVGREYEVSFWVTTDTEGTSSDIYLISATWPDINEPTKGDAVLAAKATNLKAGEWQKFTCRFTAQTEWVSLRTDAASLYFDDFMFVDVGKGVIQNTSTSTEDKPVVQEPVVDTPAETPENTGSDTDTNTDTEVTEPEIDKKPATQKPSKKPARTEQNEESIIPLVAAIGGGVLLAALIIVLIVALKKRKGKNNA